MIPSMIAKIEDKKLANIQALTACLPSANEPIKAISQIDKRITGKNIPPLAWLLTKLNILNMLSVSVILRVG